MEADAAFQTLAIAITGGAFLTVVARRYGLPTIVLLLAAGVLMGPEFLGWLQPDSIAHTLPAIVSLAIGVILFEGGLTLESGDYLRSNRVIKRILSIGALITWLGSALAVKLALGASWTVSLLAGSLVIVTGPTVIIPILRRLRLKSRLSSILHWEGVMIDAVGVFIAVLCYDLVVASGRENAVIGFGGRFLIGGAVGVIGGVALVQILRRNWVPDSLVNPFVLGWAVLVFAGSDFLLSESGLLSVTIAGLIVGSHKLEQIRQIVTFKTELTDILIGTLFLLLVSRLKLETFFSDPLPLLLAVAIVMFIVRPLNVWASTYGSDLDRREKLFLSWVAPRGIVAASMASLFALNMAEDPRFGEQAQLLEAFTYAVICCTVILQGLSADWFAKRLGLIQPRPNGWLLVGAHALGRHLALTMQRSGSYALLVDTNQRHIDEAEALGIPTLHADARDIEHLQDDERLSRCGNLLALTDNTDLNDLLATEWRPHFGKANTFSWRSGKAAPKQSDKSKAAAQPNPADSAFADLPRTGILSDEIRRGAAGILLQSGEPAAADRRLRQVLFVRTAQGFAPAALSADAAAKDNGDAAAVQGNQAVIAIVREGGYLERALARGCELTLEVSSLDELYPALVQAAVGVNPRLGAEALLAELIAQVQVFPPFPGHGIAMPHAYSRDIDQRICLHATLQTPLEVKDIAEPIRNVYFIISPAGDPQGHLATLAEIAQRHHGQD